MTELTSSQLVASCMEMDEVYKFVLRIYRRACKSLCLIGDVDNIMCLEKSPYFNIGLFLGAETR